MRARVLPTALAVISPLFAACSADRAERPAGTAMRSGPSPAALSQLAPGGVLRAGINQGNPNNAKRDPASGELRGVAVDVARDLATVLGVTLEVVPLDGVPAMLRSLREGRADVILSHNPDQDPITGETGPNASAAAGLACTPAMMGVDNTFLVAPGSPLTSVSDYDRAGIRIAVGRGNNPDLFLGARLQQSQLVRAETPALAWELVKAGRADAFAGSVDFIRAHAAEAPGARMLPGRFMVGLLAMCLPAGRPEALAYATGFIESEKASGTLGAAIRRAGLQGVDVP